MKFMTEYDVTDKWSKQFVTINDEDTLTQQSDANDCNINIIMDRYTKSGQLPRVTMEGIGGEFTEVGDYKQAMELLKAGNDAFQEVPAKIRLKEFDNDPAKFVDFASDPKNIDKLREWGLEPTPAPKKATLDDIAEILKTPKEPQNGQAKTS